MTERGRGAREPGHLGDRVAALVDGQLGHAERERVLSHLTRCEACRAEVGEQRALKSRLGLDVPAPGGLQGRLLAVGEPSVPGWPVVESGTEPVRAGEPFGAAPRLRSQRDPAQPGPAQMHPAGPHSARTRPAQPLPAQRRRSPGAAVGAVLLVGASLGGAALLADPADPPRRDPGLPDLVVEHATAATHVPLPDPAVVGAAWSATGPGGAQPVGLVARGR